jgi:hypothetical protein
MAQPQRLEERRDVRRVAGCDDVRERILSVFVPIARERVEGLELRNGVDPETDVTSVIASPLLDREGDVGPDEQQPSRHDRRQREQPVLPQIEAEQRQHDRQRGRVPLRIVKIGQQVQSRDHA